MRLMTLTRLSLLTILALLMLAVNPQANATDTGVRASEFKLSNGMEVVVIPDHRAPVVTHMVWYRVGAADEKRGKFRHRPLPRTSDVQVDRQDPGRRILQNRRPPRRPGQCLHRPGRDRILSARRQGSARQDDGDGSRPHGQSAARRKRGADRARRHSRRTPFAHRQQSGGVARTSK